MFKFLSYHADVISAVGLALMFLRLANAAMWRLAGRTDAERDKYYAKMGGAASRSTDEFFLNLFRKLFPIGLLLFIVGLLI